MSNVIPFKKSLDLLDPVPVADPAVKPSKAKITWAKEAIEMIVLGGLIPWDRSSHNGMDSLFPDKEAIEEFADLMFNMPDLEYQMMTVDSDTMTGQGHCMLDVTDKLTKEEWDLLPARHQAVAAIVAEVLEDKTYPDWRTIEIEPTDDDVFDAPDDDELTPLTEEDEVELEFEDDEPEEVATVGRSVRHGILNVILSIPDPILGAIVLAPVGVAIYFAVKWLF